METAKYSTYDVRVRAVRAVEKGCSVSAVADAYGVDRTTVHRWVQRRKRGGGNSALARRPGSGRPPKLDEEGWGRLIEITLKPASEFGYETDFWTTRRLQQVVETESALVLSRPTVWRMLRDAGLTYQKPERKYFQANEAEREEWIRKMIPRIKRTVRKYKAILYFEDEASISLSTVLGKTWSPRGMTPKQTVTGKRGSVSAMSAVSKSGHLVFTLHDKRIASDEVIHFLKQLLTHHRRRHLVVVMDRASPHVSKKTLSFIDAQKRLHVFHLPPYSPDFNPDEKIWHHLKHQELKSHQARTRADLKDLARQKLKSMSENRHLIRGIFFRCCVADLLK